MRRVMDYLGAALVLGMLWEAGSRILGAVILPPPVDVLVFFCSCLTDGAFWAHAGASACRILPALALAWCAAFPLGLALGYSRRADRCLAPLVFLTYPVPKVVLLPVFLTLFGLGDAPRIAIIALTTGYQILVVTRDSARNLDEHYLESFRSLGGTPTQLMRHVLVPAALPDAITALRVATGTAVAVLFLVESFATSTGLGFLIMDAWGRGDLLDMFSGIIAISLLGVGLYEACGLLERTLCPWKH
jgi:ABC-type nitrate/sulfonate/bicarbonate transport system, permease component